LTFIVLYFICYIHNGDDQTQDHDLEIKGETLNYLQTVGVGCKERNMSEEKTTSKCDIVYYAMSMNRI